MRKDININLDVMKSNSSENEYNVGIHGENLQGNIVFELSEKVEGIGYLQIQKNDEIENILMSNDEYYTKYYVPIKSALLDAENFRFQLRITEPENENGIPVFLSPIYIAYVGEDIGNIVEPEEYPTWLDTANSKIMEINEAIGKVSDVYTSEIERRKNESQRIADENIRKSQETTREQNENTRITNEQQRQANEVIRESNEETRKENETERLRTLEELKTLVSELETKIKDFDKYTYIIIESEENE